MESKFTVMASLTLEHTPGQKTSKLLASDFNLYKISNNIDASMYLKKGLPTQEGSKVITNVLIHALSGNIHMAHQNGFRNSAEHLRFIISELEKTHAMVTNVSESTFGEEA